MAKPHAEATHIQQQDSNLTQPDASKAAQYTAKAVAEQTPASTQARPQARLNKTTIELNISPVGQ